MYSTESWVRRPLRRKLPPFIFIGVQIATIFFFATFTFMGSSLSARAAAKEHQAAYTISGNVFDDFDQNGNQDTREPGINGVTVIAYTQANVTVATATSATDSGKVG